MLQKRPAAERGHARHGWLESWHSFSFAGYYDPRYMGVSALRVINEDHVKPGAGFGTHPHQDMEIITYVLSGTIEHKDSMGNIRQIQAGEFQLMSAGTGVTHSEYNASGTEMLDFLQIWVMPNVRGVKPSYQQRQLGKGEGLQLVVSPDGRNDSFTIHQDAFIYRLNLEPDGLMHMPLSSSRVMYLHVIKGPLQVQGQLLEAGDGLALTEESMVEMIAIADSEALIFDLP